jgi:hypothetical protein
MILYFFLKFLYYLKIEFLSCFVFVGILNTSNYTFNNMFNLHKKQYHTIRVQMDYHYISENSNKSEGESNWLDTPFWTNTHFVPCV